MSRLLRALERHWFAPASLRDLGVVRAVVFGAMLLVFYPEWDLTALMTRSPAELYKPLPMLKLFLLPLGWGARPPAELVVGVWYLGLGACLLAALGLWTRWSGLAAFLAVVFLTAHNYSFGEMHHTEALVVMAMGLLALGPSGRAFSLDALRRRRRETRERGRFLPLDPADDVSADAYWPLQAVRWMFGIVYLSAGASKLLYGGLEWMNGHTLAFYFAADGARWNMDIALWLAQFPRLLAPMSAGAVLLEATFFLAILFPRLTRPYVFGGLALHASAWLIQHAYFLPYFCAYAVFVDPVRRNPIFGPARPLPEPPPLAERWAVLFDGLCPLCMRSMATLEQLDGRGRLRYVDIERDWATASALAPEVTHEAAVERMHVVAPDGRIFRGFHAVRALAVRLPAAWIAVPFLYLPGAAWLGTRAYDALARRRLRVTCRVDTCAV